VLPIRDDNPTSRVPVMTMAIIALNLFAFLLWEPTFASGPTAEIRQQTFFYCHAEIAWETIHRTSLADGGEAAQRAIDQGHLGVSGPDLQQYLAQRCPKKSWLLAAFDSMFLHAGWLHIGGNMLFLWVFGNNVEDKLRPLRYLLFYLTAGLVATAVQTILVHSGAGAVIPNLGASGAIAGVLGAYLVMFPRRRVLTIVFFFFITWVYLPAYVLLAAWFALQAFSGVASLSSRVQSGGGVAFWAHIGGFAFGCAMALLFFPKERFRARPPPRRPDQSGRRRRGFGWPARRPPPPPEFPAPYV